ncbi:MAG: tripartite tricarboxylate transporter substrate binding protein [Ramlibacter sp.]|jgi:tripartite-type tricarboxylate transporter receptor subunit TctC|nr:tripartite tricarboxylate transporter substrate binding protein [Ramlibacter sp.]
MKKRTLLAAALAVAFGSLGANAQAQDFPSRPITIVVGAAAGGPTDIIARVLAQDLTTSLGQPVIVSNKPGANSLMATQEVARANPDGYTLLLAYNAHVVNPLLMKSARYHALNDFSPVSLAVSLPMAVIAPPNSPFATVQDVVREGRAKPETIAYGSSGNGSAPHLAGALLQTQSHTKLTHVPFKGNAPALAEVMAGRIHFMFYPMVGINKFVADNRVKLIGVTTAQRHPDFPAVPTMAETGFPGFEQTSPWIGMLAPSKTPPAVVARLDAAVKAALARADTRERLVANGALPAYRGSGDFQSFLRQDVDRWTKVIEAAGIQSND